MLQEKVFSDGEADSWFKRNQQTIKSKKSEDDHAMRFIAKNKVYFEGKSILEVGCSNGYRLNWIKSQISCNVFGFDPSSLAISDGRQRYGITEPDELFVMDRPDQFWRSRTLTAKFGPDRFACIIFGHCLYLTSPHQLPHIIAEVDSVLAEGGFVVIYDFDANPIRQAYHHTPDKDVFSYKMNYTNIFDWLPYYRLIEKKVEEHSGAMSIGNQKEDCAFTVLRKVPLTNSYLLL